MELKEKIRRQEALFSEARDNLFSIVDDLRKLLNEAGLNVEVGVWGDNHGIDYFAVYIRGESSGDISLAQILKDALSEHGIFYFLSGVRISQEQAEALKKLLA